MANPQRENGHVDIANEIMDKLCRYRIPGEVRQVMDTVFRKTYGWNKKADRISLSQFCEQYPRSPSKATCRMLMARVALEKQDDKDQAGRLLREFTKGPLLASPTAATAVVYLVEHILDREAELEESIRLLGRVMNRRTADAKARERARELRKELIARRDGKAN